MPADVERKSDGEMDAREDFLSWSFARELEWR